jgi:hypothetical protein
MYVCMYVYGSMYMDLCIYVPDLGYENKEYRISMAMPRASIGESECTAVGWKDGGTMVTITTITTKTTRTTRTAAKTSLTTTETACAVGGVRCSLTVVHGVRPN